MSNTDNSIAMVFHIFLCLKTHHLVKEYFDLFVKSGVYDRCGLILVRIRYTDYLSLKLTLKLLELYPKVHIVSFDSNDSKYYGMSEEYFRPNRYENKPHFLKLGEVESIIEMCHNTKIKSMLDNYDVCVFCHTKSASLFTKYNTRLSKDSHGINYKNNFFGHPKFVNKLKEVDVSGKFSKGGFNFFIFKVKCIESFCIKKYLLEYSKNRPLLYELNPYIKNFPIKVTSDSIVFTNRHAFANFNTVMNRMYLKNELEIDLKEPKLIPTSEELTEPHSPNL